MALENVILEVHRNTPSYTGTGDNRVKGAYKTQVYAVNIQIDDYIIGFFNIPVSAKDINAEQVLPFTSIEAYDSMFFRGAEDTTGKKTKVEKGPLAKKQRAKGRRKTARLRMEGKFIPNSRKLRTCSIIFPATFSAFLVQQALGTMIKKNNPGFFNIDGGGRYALIPCASTLMPNAKEGAWLAPGGVVKEIDPDNVAPEDPVQMAAALINAQG